MEVEIKCKRCRKWRDILKVDKNDICFKCKEEEKD